MGRFMKKTVCIKSRRQCPFNQKKIVKVISCLLTMFSSLTTLTTMQCLENLFPRDPLLQEEQCGHLVRGIGEHL